MTSTSAICDKSILITGASSGIGRALALAIAEHRPKVLILFARSVDKLAQVQKDIQRTGSQTQVITQSVDVTSAVAVKDAVQSAMESASVSHIDVAINNAGLAIGAPRSFPDLTIDEIDTMLSTNINGYMYVTHAVLNGGKMLERKQGTILNITSTTALEPPPFPGEAMYHTSKAAQECFTNVLRNELQGTNIKVLALRPGVVADTNFHAQRVDDKEDEYNDFMDGIEPLQSRSIGEAAVWMLNQPDAVSVKALDVVPTAQRSLVVMDRTWNKRNSKDNVTLN